jgi:multidrug efflux system outer membrane protein
VFDDLALARLVERTAVANRDLKTALARIRAARAERGIATGERYPDVDAFGALERSRLSEGLLIPFGGTTDRQTLGAQAFWELDLFGRITRSIEAADASLASSIEDYRDLLVVLLAEVGSTYVEVRSLQARIRFLQGNVETQQSSLELARARFETEVEPELDLRQAELNLASTESSLPSLRLALARAVHRLGVLVGEHPGALWAELADPAPIPLPPASVAVGVPADLLRQRPDVRRAERQLAAANARIGVAKAAFFPVLRLTGSGGSVSGDIESLFNWDSRVGSIGPSISLPIFAGGRNVANFNRSKSAYDESVARYRQQILVAFGDVENSLAGIRHLGDQFVAQNRAVANARRAAELAADRYRAGIVSYLEVVDADRAALQTERFRAQLAGQRLAASVQLIKALGGGWREPSLARTTAP